MGDFNARPGTRRIGEDNILGPYSSGKRTRNGEKLIELANSNNLTILNSQYKKRAERRWTWLSPGGLYKNEIDYILTNIPKNFNDCGVVSNLNFNTNHRMVRAKLKIAYTTKHRPFKAKTKTLNQVGNSPNLVEHLEAFKNSLQSSNTSVQEKYNTLNEILTNKNGINSNSTAKTTKDRYSKSTKDLLDKRSQLINNRSKTREIRKGIAVLSKEIKLNMRKDKQHLRLKTFETFIARTGGIKKAIKILKDHSDWIPNIKNKAGQKKSKRPEILATATEFYRDLYSKKTDTPKTMLNNSAEVPPILVDEVQKAIEKQKNDKAPGPDLINNELIIEYKETIAPILKDIFDSILEMETVPTQWTKSTITLIHKKGDVNDINNYRPISLMSNIYKVFARIILDRITKPLDENQPREQAGFRTGYSTLDHIHVVKQVFEKYKEFNIPFYCCFVDYRKAFDTIEHECIWQALKTQGVEEKYIRIIRNIYRDSKSRIKLENEGEDIGIDRGVRQGDPMSAKLFTAVLEQIFRKLNWNEYGLNINGEQLTHLRFADDLILFASSKEDLQKMLTDLSEESVKVGLEMNTQKTKAMTNSVEDPIFINNQIIEYEKEYVYLGQLISTNDLMSKEIDMRIANAWKRYWGLKEIMKNRDTKTFYKRKLFSTCILPILTYGCQTWALTKKHLRKLQTCQHAMERSMLSIRKLQKIRNTTIRNITKVSEVTTKVKKLKWRWTGHISRGIEKWSRTIMSWYPRNGKRNRGRQFRRWEDEIKMTAGSLWSRLAQNRMEWKGMEEAFANNRQTEEG